MPLQEVLLRNGTRHPHPRVKDKGWACLSGADGKSCTCTAQRGRAAGTCGCPLPTGQTQGLQMWLADGARAPDAFPTLSSPGLVPPPGAGTHAPGPLAAAAGARRRLSFQVAARMCCSFHPLRLVTRERRPTPPAPSSFLDSPCSLLTSFFQGIGESPAPRALHPSLNHFRAPTGC